MHMPPPEYKAIDSSEGLFPIQYDFVDFPSEHRIEISFLNKRGQAVCLYPNYWPASGGAIDSASEGVFLVLGQRRFPLEKVDTGYCPGCAQYVAPGETIRASIPYKAFHLPEALFSEKKQLEFVPKAFRCEKRK
jgi:hypothetical protein